MKNKLFLTAFFVAALFYTAQAQVPNYVPINGLEAWYPFNGNANDLSGNGNNCNVYGAILVNDRFGNSNKAYSFSVVNSSYILSPLIQNNLSNLSISLWFKTNDHGFFYQGSRSCNNGGFGLRLLMDYNSPLSYHIIFGSDGVSYQDYTVTDSVYNDNNWHHIVGVWNSNTATNVNQNQFSIYLDGVLVAQTSGNYGGTTPNIPLQGTGNVYFGADMCATPLYNGILDDIGIWNRALTPQEITALYQGQSCPNHPVTITPTGNTTFCAGGNVGLNASTVSGYNYQWYMNGSALSGSTGISFTTNQAGLFKVIIDSSGCYDTSNVISVNVNPNPSVTLSVLSPFILKTASNVTLNGLPTGGTYSGAGVSGSIFSPSAAGLGYKTITYSYTNANGCIGSSTQHTTICDTMGCTQTIYVYDTIKTYLAVTDTLVINAVLTGIAPPNNINLIKVFPNPASDHLIINYGNYASMSGYTVKVVNSLAQTVYSSVISQQQVSINLSTWSGKGTYFLSIINGVGAVIETRKIVLQ